ncbi:hypothetical protein B0H13DRAFT_2303687 [Mycena leptocephala]|nr:hypothetical protein B0H13DRAFT_2303687 [Mycena leptocephala]
MSDSKHPSAHDAASEDNYIATFNAQDLRFASLWRHKLVVPPLKLILDYEDDIAKDWPISKDDVIEAINSAYPILKLLHAKFPEKRAKKLDSVLLDVWYGYTRLLALVETGPEEWKEEVPDDFSFPRITPVRTSGTLKPCDAEGDAEMPTDVLKKPKRATGRSPGSRSAPTTPSNEPESGKPSGSLPQKAALKRPSTSKRIRFDGLDLPTADTVTSTPSKPSTRSKDKSSTSGTPRRTPAPKPERNDPIEDEGGSDDADGEEEVDSDGDVEMKEVKLSTTRSGRSVASAKPAAAGPSKARGKKEKPLALSEIDAAALGKAVEDVFRKHQNNRKATSGSQFNIATDGQPRIVSTVRFANSSQPTFYNGLPATDIGKRYKLSDTRVEGKRITVSEATAITDEVNTYIPTVPCINCIITGKDCTPVAYGTFCDNCKSGSFHSCTYNKDAGQVVEFIRRLVALPNMSLFRILQFPLLDHVSAANDARHLADEAAHRVAKRFAHLGLNALVVIDKFGPAPLLELFDDETPETVLDFFNGVLDQHNDMLGASSTLPADEWKPRLAASDLVNANALSSICASAFKFAKEQKVDKGKVKAD